MRKLEGSSKAVAEPQGAGTLLAAHAANVKKVSEVGRRSHHTSQMSKCHDNLECQRRPFIAGSLKAYLLVDGSNCGANLGVLVLKRDIYSPI